MEVRHKTSTSSFEKSEKHLERRLHSIRALNPRSKSNSHIYKKLVKIRVSEFKVSELVTSFLISSPGSLVFTIVSMIMRALLVVSTIGKTRGSGTLSYQLTGNS